MFVVSAKEFRANQSKALEAAMNGQEVRLISKRGHFKITDVIEEDTLTSRIVRGLDQVQQIEEGNLPRRTLQDMLDEL